MPRTDFGQDEHDGLEDDKDPVQDGPERAASLIRNGAVSTSNRQTCQGFLYIRGTKVAYGM